MNLDNVLKNLDATLAPTEKTAAAAAPAATRASSLVDDAVRSVSSQPKLASATAEGALDKLAAHMASQSAEGAAKVGTRILVAALKEPLPQAKAEFLQLRMVVAAVPLEGLTAKALLARLAVLLDEQLRAPTDRRIVSVSAQELLA